MPAHPGMSTVADPQHREPPLRFGVLGCADIARRRVLPALLRTPGARLAAVASRDPGRARQVADTFGCAPVAGYQALLERDDIDAVYLPLPPALHPEWIRRALTAGKHVLAEKPLTTSSAETAELTALATASQRVLAENVMFVHHPRHERVRRLVADGAVGVPQTFTAAFTVPRRPPGDIRLSAELGGGALLDIGGYPLRAAQFFLGPDLRVAGAALRTGEGAEVDCGGGALLVSGDGATAQLTFGLDHAYVSRYEILGSTGRITVDRAFTPPADHVGEIRLDRADGTEVLPTPAADQCVNTLAAFVRAVRTGAPAAGHGTLRRQAELIEEIRRAAGTTDREPGR
ncbi:Gfo/Idh/MocA family protein [Streptomyces lydicus]|uniref:Gfo/Idh/MocA family protein n=1 Tax=Streptomyces lydicus TaxID=47763 RepID=UPI0037B9E885